MEQKAVKTEQIISSECFAGPKPLFPTDISLFDLLNDEKYHIIPLSKFEYLLPFWQSQSFEWHVNRGLKLTSQEHPSLKQRYSHVDKSNISRLTKDEIKSIAKGVKSQIFCVSSTNTGTHTASVG